MKVVNINTLVAGDQITYCTDWLESHPPQPRKVEGGRVASIVHLGSKGPAVILAGPQHYAWGPRGVGYKGPVLRQGDVISVGGNAQGEARHT